MRKIKRDLFAVTLAIVGAVFFILQIVQLALLEYKEPFPYILYAIAAVVGILYALFSQPKTTEQTDK